MYLIDCIPWLSVPRKRDRPYVYSPTVILRCFIVMLMFRSDSNNALYIFFNMNCQNNHKIALACGLVSIPSSRRMFDRRLKTISTDIKQRISAKGNLFVTEGMVMVDDDHSIAAVDSTLMKANGSVWYKSSMKKGIVPRSGIDTYARW
jgi:hypothetical protein